MRPRSLSDMPIGGSKYKHFLEDDADVRRWYENLEAKSVITAGVYLRTLGLYCASAKTTPRRILAEAESKKYRDGFTDFIRSMEKDGKAGSYIERFKKVILSWTSQQSGRKAQGEHQGYFRHANDS